MLAYRLAPALVALIGLFAYACSPKPVERSVDNPNVIDEYEEPGLAASEYRAPAGGFTPDVVLSAVNEAGGLTNLPKGLAVSVLDDYITRLTAVPAASGLVPDLQMIREELTSGIIDRGDVGAALSRLARGTRALAPEGSPYKALASALALTGDQLGGDVDDLDVGDGR